MCVYMRLLITKLTLLKIRWTKAFHTTCNSVFCNNTEELNIVICIICLLNIFDIDKGEKIPIFLFLYWYDIWNNQFLQ